MQDISVEIARLLQFGMQRGLLEKADCTYAANRMLAVLGLDGWDDAVEPPAEALEIPVPILEAISDWAYDGVRAVYGVGAMTGTTGTTFSAKSNYTIEQSVVTLMRIDNNWARAGRG